MGQEIYLYPSDGRLLMLTSTAYIFPLTLALYHQEFRLAVSYGSIFASSLYYHGAQTTTSYWIDQAAIGNFALQKWIEVYSLGTVPMGYSTMVGLIAMYIYFWGRYTTTLAFSTNKDIRVTSHGTLHSLTAFLAVTNLLWKVSATERLMSYYSS